MFLTCLGCSGQKYALTPDQPAPHNALANQNCKGITSQPIFLVAGIISSSRPLEHRYRSRN